MPQESVKELMGIVVENNQTSIQGTKLKSDGPLLITHWGMSGPAILKLSAWGARLLYDKSYQFNVQVNWLSIKNESEVNKLLDNSLPILRKKKIANANPFGLANRMWLFLVHKVGINPDSLWLELSKKNLDF